MLKYTTGMDTSYHTVYQVISIFFKRSGFSQSLIAFLSSDFSGLEQNRFQQDVNRAESILSGEGLQPVETQRKITVFHLIFIFVLRFKKKIKSKTESSETCEYV